MQQHRTPSSFCGRPVQRQVAIALLAGLSCVAGMCTTAQWTPAALQSKLLASEECVAYVRFGELSVDCWYKNLSGDSIAIDPTKAVAELPDGKIVRSSVRAPSGPNATWSQAVKLAPGERKQALVRFGPAQGWAWADYESAWIELAPAVKVGDAPLSGAPGTAGPPVSLGLRVTP